MTELCVIKKRPTDSLWSDPVRYHFMRGKNGTLSQVEVACGVNDVVIAVHKNSPHSILISDHPDPPYTFAGKRIELLPDGGKTYFEHRGKDGTIIRLFHASGRFGKK